MRTAWIAVGVLVTSGLAGCVPSGSAVVSPTEPARGCHDNLGSPSAPDVAYSGEPSAYGNLTFWTSTDGSCSGGVVQATIAASTLIVADGSANAEFLCRNLLRAAALPGDFDARTGPWSPAFGPLGYVCAG